MLRKTCALADFKMIEEGHGSLSGYGSTHGTKDLAGEIVVKGAFAKSLDQFKAAGFIAVGHEWSDLPVATVADAYEDEKGLFVKGEFHSSDDAQKARTYVRERLERGKSVGLSIGYTVKDSERTKAGLLLKEIDLWECSIVTVPCNPMAQATGVKELTDAPLSLIELREVASAAYLLALDAADADEDVKSELSAHFKDVFAEPAPAAGRLYEQLDAALAAVKSVTDRFSRYVATKEADGRNPSPDRREQLLAVHGALVALIEKTAPAPQLDIDLLRMKASARRRRVAVASGAHDE